MFDPKNFTTPHAKPLPVFLLLDISGTMGEVIDPENAVRTGETVYDDGKYWDVVEGGTSKIDLLNDAVQKMLETLKEDEMMDREYRVSIITFGDDASLHLPPTRASDVKWQNMTAGGETAMGAAFKLTKSMIEDKETTPSRAYRPTIILVSDGQPNDDWQDALEDIISRGRSAKCDRMAMAIGRDADKQVLSRFIENTPHQLFYSENAEQLHEFFQHVTMSTTLRSHSKNPNEIPTDSEIDLDIMTANGKSESKDLAEAAEKSGDEGYW
jgi:uncharacterized protein YegL